MLGYKKEEVIGFIFCLIFSWSPLFSQININGTIKDSSTKQVIPFASVGVLGNIYSTLTDANGNFEITLPHLNDTDSLRVSSIGYSNLSVAGSELKKNPKKVFYLKSMVYDLTEVKVKANNVGYKTLGTAIYSKDVCTAFTGISNSWRGEQAAIKANNKQGTTVYLESFNFYIIKNTYPDSLQFRIMLYEVDTKGYPGETFLKKPIVFKTHVQQGEVHIDLNDYNISTSNDFFISLECLEEKMEATRFCFAGSIKVPSFVKTSVFGPWIKAKGGGGDFNVRVSYLK